MSVCCAPVDEAAGRATDGGDDGGVGGELGLDLSEGDSLTLGL